VVKLSEEDHNYIKDRLIREVIHGQPPKLLEYYKDQYGQEEADVDENGNVRLRFTEIPIQGRESKTTLYVKNAHSYPIQLEPVTTDPDLSIPAYPSRILPDQIAPVTFVFAPKPDRITPLNASWDFEKTIYEE
jgi:hypothetical protein